MKSTLNSLEKSLLNQAQDLAKRHRKLESELIAVLTKIDQTRCYKKLGYSSLFTYAVRELGFTEAVAYSFITVTRKLSEIPQLQSAIQSQEISIAKASRIVSVINKENAGGLIDFAQAHTTRETDREVERLNPSKKKKVDNDLVRRAQSLLSSKLGRAVSREEAIDLALQNIIERLDPVEKAKRAENRKEKRATEKKGKENQDQQESPQLQHNEKMRQTKDPLEAHQAKSGEKHEGRATKLCANRVTIKRILLTAEEKHTVFLRDQGRCTFIDVSGKRCENDRWLDTHHIIPIHQGGTNDPENLTLLCSDHHDLVHQLCLPLEGQVTWLR